MTSSRHVLIHGLGGSPQVWGGVADQLADARAVTLRGGTTVEAEATLIARDLAGGPAVVVGHSLGGLVAVALAEQHPAHVGRLVLIATPPTSASRTAARGASERLLRTPVVGPALWRAAGPRGLRSGLRSAVAPGTAVPEVMVDDLRAWGHRRWAGSTAAIDEYLAAAPLEARLAALTVRVTIVVGLADQRVDPAASAPLDALPHVEVRHLDRVGHTPPLEAPEVTLRAIDDEPIG